MTRLLQALLILVAILMLLPFWVMIVSSFSSQSALNQGVPLLWPDGLHLEQYQKLLTDWPIATYTWNSAWIAMVTTVGHVLCCAMAGYAFSRLKFKGKNVLFLALLITLMVPPQVNIIPLFFLMKQFQWLDTPLALIVPGLFGAYGVFMFRQWFNTLPKELEDAAVIDGCSPWQTFWLIALPLARPAVAALAIFVFINTWNSFMWPLIAIHSPEQMTLPIGIATLKSSFRDAINWPLLMAASTLSILPVIGLFLLGQRQFIAGLMSGGGKE